jgi:hypothetical protein
MALRFYDGFDHYLPADITLKWTTASSVTRETGLHGFGLRGSVSKGMLFPGNTLLLEMFVKRVTNAGDILFAVSDNGANNGHIVISQVSCRYLPDGTIVVQRDGSSPAIVGQTLPDLLRRDTWYHVGWKVLVHATAGAVEVRVNGGVVLSVTGVPTITTIPLGWSGVVGSFSVGGGQTVVDDFLAMDAVDDGLDDPRLPGGGGFDKFLGPVEIVVKRPNGAGLLAEWTPTPTVPNYQNVDDPTPDGDATHNGALPTAVGASDLFQMEHLLPDEDVVAVQSLVLARKTEEGTAAIARLVRDGGTTSVGATAYQPNTYSYLHTPEPTRPDGSLWTVAAWNAIQYGYRRII